MLESDVLAEGLEHDFAVEGDFWCKIAVKKGVLGGEDLTAWAEDVFRCNVVSEET